jgi:capsular exopolysaccharide synthesis family protein
MSRIEEALKRAQRAPRLPESFATPESAALEQFQTSEFRETEPEAPPEPQAERIDTLDAFEAEVPRVGHTVVRSPAPTIPTLTSLESGGSFRGKLVVNDNVKDVTVEQYRRLAAALHYAQGDDGTKVVMVASAMPGEGKTLTAVNLALTLSESYARRVLLIDADFRRPTLHQVFQVPNLTGLTDGLKSATERKLTLIELSPRLSLLPAGRPDPDPMSGLTSDRMRRVIEEAAAKHDWVIIDTPPVGLLTDAHLLAAMVNAAVLVIKAGQTPCAMVQRAVARLDRSRIIGVVLNWVDDRATSPGGKYADYYSSYYSRSATADAKTVS